MPTAINAEMNTNLGSIGQIPVRNLWLLMLYASDLFRELNKGSVAVEDNPDDIPDLIAELLSHIVERRLKRNLSFGYQTKNSILNRVRGRIDLLTTERHRLLSRGQIACRFEDLTINTKRNRFVRAALETISAVVTNRTLAKKCKVLANSFENLGVSGIRPTLREISVDRYGRHDIDDKLMVSAAQLAFEIALPTESAGSRYLSLPAREITWVRKLFEKAIGGFYDVVLPSDKWKVYPGRTYHWMIDHKTASIDQILPLMITDIVLENIETNHRIVIDTKFNSILTSGWYREKSIRSGYIYQIYTYLRSQERPDDIMANRATGLLLHPAIGHMIDETVLIQGHAIRFATVDLAAKADVIRKQLLNLVKLSHEFQQI